MHFNPKKSTAGPIPIDPRLGSTMAPSALQSLPLITAYNAPVASYNSPVNFPRTKRSLISKLSMDVKDYIDVEEQKNGKHKIKKRQSCMCVASGTCISNSGAGLIDIRIVTPVSFMSL